MGPSVDWWQADFGQELLEGRDGMQIVEGRVRRYIDGLVVVPVIAGLQVLKCRLRVSQARRRFSCIEGGKLSLSLAVSLVLLLELAFEHSGCAMGGEAFFRG